MSKHRSEFIRFNDRMTRKNPEFSLTPVAGGKLINVFRETDDMDLGNHHPSRVKSLGFTDEQLSYVVAHGTTNFVRRRT